MNEKDKLAAEEIGYAFQDLLGFAARVDLENRIVGAFATVRQEAREAAFREAINLARAELVPDAPEGSLNEDFNAATNDIIRVLDAAADSTQKDNVGKGEDDG